MEFLKCCDNRIMEQVLFVEGNPALDREEYKLFLCDLCGKIVKHNPNHWGVDREFIIISSDNKDIQSVNWGGEEEILMTFSEGISKQTKES